MEEHPQDSNELAAAILEAWSWFLRFFSISDFSKRDVSFWWLLTGPNWPADRVEVICWGGTGRWWGNFGRWDQELFVTSCDHLCKEVLTLLKSPFEASWCSFKHKRKKNISKSHGDLGPLLTSTDFWDVEVCKQSWQHERPTVAKRPTTFVWVSLWNPFSPLSLLFRLVSFHFTSVFFLFLLLLCSSCSCESMSQAKTSTSSMVQDSMEVPIQVPNGRFPLLIWNVSRADSLCKWFGDKPKMRLLWFLPTQRRGNTLIWTRTHS